MIDQSTPRHRLFFTWLIAVLVAAVPRAAFVSNQMDGSARPGNSDRHQRG